MMMSLKFPIKHHLNLLYQARAAARRRLGGPGRRGPLPRLSLPVLLRPGVFTEVASGTLPVYPFLKKAVIRSSYIKP